MQVFSPNFLKNKRVLLRLDFDIPLEKGKIVDDFRLRAGLPTLKLCLKHAKEVIIMGHLGRPEGKQVKELSVAPILDWLEEELAGSEELKGEKLKILENLRFEKGEEECNLDFAKELASLGDVFINEAFASYHKSASTTVLPKLLPHFAGLRFVREVEVLREIREYPGGGLVVIIGGVKVEDKLPVIETMSGIAEMVLVGGKLIKEIQNSKCKIQNNVVVGELNKEGTDITPETNHVWKQILLHHAKKIIWNGPVGKVEEMGSERGTYELAKAILESRADIVAGGGDTVGFLGEMGLLEEFEGYGFVSTGGGAMLEFLTTGTLETLEAL